MNGWDEIKDEKELLAKLFSESHLNVPERQNLPNGKVRASAAKELIKNSLVTSNWFPGSKQYPVGDEGGSYYQLELCSNGKSILHHNYEYSYLRYDHKVSVYRTMDKSIKAYLKAKEKEGLDGLVIDWRA